MNHGVSNRQPVRRPAGNNSSNISNGPGSFPNSFSSPPPVDLRPQAPPPPYPVIQIPPNTAFVNGVPPYRNNNGWGPRGPVGAYGVSVDEQRNANRRGNYGNRPHNNNIRRNQDPGNINTRDVHGHQHRMQSGRFSRPTAPNSASFLGSLGSQPIRPYVNPAGFHGQFINLFIQSCFYYKTQLIFSFLFRILLLSNSSTRPLRRCAIFDSPTSSSYVCPSSRESSYRCNSQAN